MFGTLFYHFAMCHLTQVTWKAHWIHLNCKVPPSSPNCKTHQSDAQPSGGSLPGARLRDTAVHHASSCWLCHPPFQGWRSGSRQEMTRPGDKDCRGAMEQDGSPSSLWAELWALLTEHSLSSSSWHREWRMTLEQWLKGALRAFIRNRPFSVHRNLSYLPPLPGFLTHRK